MESNGHLRARKTVKVKVKRVSGLARNISQGCQLDEGVHLVSQALCNFSRSCSDFKSESIDPRSWIERSLRNPWTMREFNHQKKL